MRERLGAGAPEFGQRHAAGGDLRVVPPAVARDRHVERQERSDERAPGVLRQVGAGGGRVHAGDVAQRAGEALGQTLAQDGGDRRAPQAGERCIKRLLVLARQEVHHERGPRVVAVRVGVEAADVHARGAGKAEVRQQERVGELGDALAPPVAHADRGDGGQPAQCAQRVIPGRGEGYERGEDARGDGVPQRAHDLVSFAVGAGFRQRAPAHGEDRPAGQQPAPPPAVLGGGVFVDGEAAALERAHRSYPVRVDHLHARVARGAEKSVQHRARAVGRREEFAGLLALERHAQPGEELDGALDAEAQQHLANGVAARSGVVRLADRVVGDVAAPAPRDKDLRPQRACAVEHDDPQRPRTARRARGATGLDRSHQARGARPHHRDVRVRRLVHAGA
jgi:hypothetical protein